MGNNGSISHLMSDQKNRLTYYHKKFGILGACLAVREVERTVKITPTGTGLNCLLASLLTFSTTVNSIIGGNRLTTTLPTIAHRHHLEHWLFKHVRWKSAGGLFGVQMASRESPHALNADV